ncbi:putative membrane protein [Nocardia sp. GAS34]|uniref:CopD family protein n=1 Tax=unclassified Nocardia TaxID=2637762 RepID=UPI003D228435
MYETAERERISAGSVSIRSAARRHMRRVRFGTVAICAVGVLIVSGAWLTWTHIGTPVQMLTTPYGRHLTVKLVMVAAMPAVGTYNSRVLLPGIAAARERGDHATAGLSALRNFPVAVAVEAILAVGVLLVVPFLAGSGRTQAGWPAARAFDPTLFGTGVPFVALVVAALWAGGRARVRRAPVREIRCGAE